MNGGNSEQTSDEIEESEEEPENVLNMQLNASDGLFTNKTYTFFFSYENHFLPEPQIS